MIFRHFFDIFHYLIVAFITLGAFLPKKYLTAHMIAANSKIIFKDYGHIKGKYEDCEHRAFHMKAINNDNAKIMITKDILFY